MHKYFKLKIVLLFFFSFAFLCVFLSVISKTYFFQNYFPILIYKESELSSLNLRIIQTYHFLEESFFVKSMSIHTKLLHFFTQRSESLRPNSESETVWTNLPWHPDLNHSPSILPLGFLSNFPSCASLGKTISQNSIKTNARNRIGEPAAHSVHMVRIFFWQTALLIFYYEYLMGFDSTWIITMPTHKTSTDRAVYVWPFIKLSLQRKGWWIVLRGLGFFCGWNCFLLSCSCLVKCGGLLYWISISLSDACLEIARVSFCSD